MSSEFVVTKKVLKGVIDGEGPLGIFMSVVPTGKGRIDLVIGARYEDKCACSLNVDCVGELIEMLKEIQEAM